MALVLSVTELVALLALRSTAGCGEMSVKTTSGAVGVRIMTFATAFGTRRRCGILADSGGMFLLSAILARNFRAKVELVSSLMTESAWKRHLRFN